MERTYKKFFVAIIKLFSIVMLTTSCKFETVSNEEGTRSLASSDSSDNSNNSGDSNGSDNSGSESSQTETGPLHMAIQDNPSGMSYVSTFESIGIYFRGFNLSAENTAKDASVKFRKLNDLNWRDGLPLVYDKYDKEFRGSLLNLKPNTIYEIVITLNGGSVHKMSARTWNENLRIKKIVYLDEYSEQTLNITESGEPDGYILYTSKPNKTATIDVKRKNAHNIIINARYIIIRGLNLKNAKDDAILLGPNREKNSNLITNVIIEDNDITGWGSFDDNNCNKQKKLIGSSGVVNRNGVNVQAGVYSYSRSLERIIIQRNNIHHPFTDSNNWEEYNCDVGRKSKHPQGPEAIVFRESLGNHVIRHNAIYSDDDHTFNDSMGELGNFTDRGFPNKDSDIYSNYISHVQDDGIESEGSNKNVRIWGNYIGTSIQTIAIATVYHGPIYIFRNIGGASRTIESKDSPGLAFIKWRTVQPFMIERARLSGSTIETGRYGTVYLINNTTVVPAGTKNYRTTWVGDFREPSSERLNWEHPIDKFRVYNNVMNVGGSNAASIRYRYGSQNGEFDFNLTNGQVTLNGPGQQNGQVGSPNFESNILPTQLTLEANFQLASGSKGHDDGVVIPTISDSFEGSGPDIGAHERNSEPMRFGPKAAVKSIVRSVAAE